jgi:hypothetical protein
MTSLRYGASIVAVACWGLAVVAEPAAEAEPDVAPTPRLAELIRFNASASPYYQGGTALDNGGEFELSIVFTRFNVALPVSRRTRIGLSVSFDYHDYEFSGSTALGGARPWDDMRRIGLAVPVTSRVAEKWVLDALPSIDSFNRSIGVGLGAFDQLEELFVFPFLAVNWSFTERLRLTNPFRAGPTGPAGLELIYDLGRRWFVAGGAAFRFARFRLSEQGAVPNGVGENTGIPAFVRVQKELGKAIKLDLYGGAVLDGELRLEDEFGNVLARDGYETAPFLALTLAGDF